MKRLTIKDMAKMLSLSTSTVSRALSDHPDISEATKKRVREVAEELNYRANVHAKLFRSQSSGLIALVMPEVNMFFSPKLIKAINKVISATNYSLITFLSNDSYKTEKEIIQHCLNWSVEGVLISLSKETYNINHLLPLAKANIECVLFDKTVENELYPSVMIDSLDSSYKAVSYMIKKGHSNILGVFGNPGLNISKERLAGYERAHKENNLPIIKENIVFVDDQSHLDFILPPILNHNRNITGLFTMSDELLSKCIYHLNRLSIRIPDDISVISISDGQYPYLVYPLITHIKDSGTKMGKTSAKILMDRITNEGATGSTSTIVTTKLVELDSVKSLDLY